MFKLSGSVKMKADTVQVSEKFSKREFVITDASSMYPQDIMFQLTQDKCSLIDAVNVGDQVEVSFNLRGREWTSPQGEVKYFNTLEAWRVEKMGAGNAMGGGIPQSGATPMNIDPIPSSPSTQSADDDDLPF